MHIISLIGRLTADPPLDTHSQSGQILLLTLDELLTLHKGLMFLVIQNLIQLLSHQNYTVKHENSVKPLHNDQLQNYQKPQKIRVESPLESRVSF